MPATIDDASILIHFFDAERRRIVARPRTIEIADDFVCLADQQNGWNALQEKIRKGEDLAPHMSKLLGSLVNNDGLLNEWGVTDPTLRLIRATAIQKQYSQSSPGNLP